jgi:hypothetical protein
LEVQPAASCEQSGYILGYESAWLDLFECLKKSRPAVSRIIGTESFSASAPGLTWRTTHQAINDTSPWSKGYLAHIVV